MDFTMLSRMVNGVVFLKEISMNNQKYKYVIVVILLGLACHLGHN